MQDDVSFDLQIDGVSAQLAVRHLSVHEGLNRLGEAEVVALVTEAPAIADLLGKDCTIHWSRRTQERKYKGVIRTASVRDLVEGAELTVHVVPAAWMLTRTLDSYIHQNITVPKIVEKVINDLLGPRQRSVRMELQRDYPQYEYVVQYQESHWSFIARLLEQEGIFAYFDHEDGDHEKLVLCDSTANLPFVRSADQGRVPYARDSGQAPEDEAVTSVHHHREVGATDAVVRDFDWTNPGLDVKGSQTGRGNGSPALQIYDHTDAVQFHRYGGTSYGANTAERQAELRAELLDLGREGWSMDATVVTAMPGRILELSGAPDELDGKYLIVSSDAYGHATEGRQGTFHTRLRCVPQDLPYHPPRITRRPVVLGLETATVVGPAGEEIHTDEHGRVRVQFHWDRHGRNDEHSTCWLRVMQNWAHGGYGTFFLPRIGMEVVVGFIGGSPDRPIVTGCVYNGRNTTPYPLPADKTKSTLKTQSSPGGGGYNELRFEDKAGQEEVFIHAQKDFNEVVEHNHTTRVHANHTNTVFGDDTETVHNYQTLTVKKDRKKIIEKNEVRVIQENRTTKIQIDDTTEVAGTRTTTIGGAEGRTVGGTRTTEIGRLETVTCRDSRVSKVIGNDELTVTEEMLIDVTQAFVVRQKATMLEMRSLNFLVDAGGSIQLKKSRSKVEIDSSGGITVKSPTNITLEAGASKITMTNGNITLEAPGGVILKSGGSEFMVNPGMIMSRSQTIMAVADGVNSIIGGLVTIN
jgi:type VI secretion system secreted protein VgrG